MKLARELGKAAAAISVGFLLYTAGSSLANWFSQPSSEYDYRPAQGVLKYQDGTALPEKEVRLTFYPLDVPFRENLSPRAGIAVLDGDGVFRSVTSLHAGDGLIRAKYRVTITTMAGHPLSPTTIDRKYGHFDLSPLEITFDSQPLDISVPRPSKKQTR